MWKPAHFEHAASFTRTDRDPVCERPHLFTPAAGPFSGTPMYVSTDLRVLLALDLDGARTLPHVPEADPGTSGGGMIRTVLERGSGAPPERSDLLLEWLVHTVPAGEHGEPSPVRVGGVTVDGRLLRRALAPLPPARVRTEAARCGPVAYLDVLAPRWRLIVASFRPPVGLLPDAPDYTGASTPNLEEVA